LTDLRIVLVGGLGAGKSTLLSYITHGTKDNGRGSARLNLLRHRHELESGRSSSISHEIIGYDAEGHLINYATTHINTWEQICEASHKVITLLDTCGYPKYLRTTISGLMGYAPDYACLVIAANSAANKSTPTIDDMTREHLSIAVMLDVPVFVVMTKSDVATHDQLKSTLHLLLNLLKSSLWLKKKVPVVVQNENDVVTYASCLGRQGGGSELPIFLVSNVTGSNMNLLQMFFNYLPKPKRMNYDEQLEEPAEFQIEEVYRIPDVGVVVGGVLGQGRINVKEKDKKYYLGPNTKGEFTLVNIISVHRHRVPSHYVHCGQTATLALQNRSESEALSSWKISRGMVLLAAEDDKKPDCYRMFEAELTVVYHATGVSAGTCGMIHSGSIRQRAKVMSETNAAILRTGKKGTCCFSSMYEPCYLKLGSQILFLEGRSKCIGRVTKL
ncbi:P-loop containing nucleoside triphosphate hydrolase protein, partial [Mycotypha africana]|uniref:P-loop containing nucleoside triphosphate hydrolase protein n=1 Tax=Mycotypha africana TaxID=64632 RepID=UPI00230125C9